MDLVIIGDGEFAQIAYEYFTHDSDDTIAAFAVEKDYRSKDSLCGLPVVDLESIETSYPSAEYKVFVAVSFVQLNRVRARLYKHLKDLGYSFASYVSSQAFVWRNASIGENVFIFENNVVQPFVTIGNNVVLWSGNHIGHQSVIGDHCFISSHVVISGFCKVGNYTFMGVNSCVADEVSIGEDNFIGMACVINKDTEPNKVYRTTPSEAAKIPAKRFFKIKD